MIEIFFTLTYFELYILIVSFLSFLYYGYDKLQAIKNLKHEPRVPEKMLLLSSFLGGVIGSFLAMVIFRHKIKKASFMIKFFIVFIIQLVLIYLNLNNYLNLGSLAIPFK